MITSSAAIEPRDNPYFGLDYYEERFSAWFFGRETDRARIITNLRAARLTLLHAESGVGKSSLLRAGVAARLREVADEAVADGVGVADIPVVFSSWTDNAVAKLIEALAHEVRPFLPEERREGFALPLDRLDVAITTAADAAGAGLLIILDQFEEYFLYSGRESPPEFLADELGRCIENPDLPANFLIAIREDAYAGLGDMFKGRIANVYRNYLQIDNLDRDDAERAIRNPLAVYNRQPGTSPVEIEDALVDGVLQQVRAGAHAESEAAEADDGAVEAPLLQLVLDRIWKHEEHGWTNQPSESPRILRRATLDELHGVGRIVEAHLEEALGTLDEEGRRTAIDAFDRLVTSSGAKIAVSISDLSERIDHDEVEIRRTLEKLDEQRIVRSIAAPPGVDPVGGRRYEIFHDVLGPAINERIADEKRKRLAREQEEAARRAEAELQSEARSEAARRRAQLLRRWLLLAVAALTITAAAVVVAVYELDRATVADKTARSLQLAADASATLDQDPALSVLLALRGVEAKPTTQARAALSTALARDQELRVLKNGAAVNAAEYDPVRPGLVVSAGEDGITRIWSLASGRPTVVLKPKTFLGPANAVAFNSAGTKVAVAYGEGYVVQFSVATGRPSGSPAAMPSSVYGVAYVFNDVLAVAMQSGSGLWVPPYKFSIWLSHREADSIAIDPVDPLKFAVAGPDATIVATYDVKTGKPTDVHRLQGADDAEFSRHGTLLVTGASDGKVRTYSFPKLSNLRTLDAGGPAVNTAAVSPTGLDVVAAYGDGSTRVWDADRGVPLTLLTGDTGPINTARFSPNGTEVLTASTDGTVRTWDVAPRELVDAFSDPGWDSRPDPTLSAQYSPTNRNLVVVDEQAGNAFVYPAAGATDHPAIINPGPTTSVDSARFDDTGRKIVTADSDGSVRVWDVQGHPIGPRSPIHDAATYADFNPRGSRLLILTQNYTAEVRDAKTGANVFHHAIRSPDRFEFTAGAFSPDGGVFVTGDGWGEIDVWKAGTGRLLHRLGRGGDALIEDVEFSRTGARLVTTGNDGIATIWSTRTWGRVRAISTCGDPSTASFSPDGKAIVVACGDGTLSLYDAATGVLLSELAGTDTASVSSASFRPDGHQIVATYGGSGGVRIWSADLVTPSLAALERIARERSIGPLTPTQRREYGMT